MFVFNSGKGGIKCECCNRLIFVNPITRQARSGRDLHYCSDRCLKLHYLKDKLDRKRGESK